MCEFDETAVPPCNVTFINGITRWRVMRHAGSRQMEKSKSGHSDSNKKKTLSYTGLRIWDHGRLWSGYDQLWCSWEGNITESHLWKAHVIIFITFNSVCHFDVNNGSEEQ